MGSSAARKVQDVVTLSSSESEDDDNIFALISGKYSAKSVASKNEQLRKKSEMVVTIGEDDDCEIICDLTPSGSKGTKMRQAPFYSCDKRPMDGIGLVWIGARPFDNYEEEDMVDFREKKTEANKKMSNGGCSIKRPNDDRRLDSVKFKRRLNGLINEESDSDSDDRRSGGIKIKKRLNGEESDSDSGEGTSQQKKPRNASWSLDDGTIDQTSYLVTAIPDGLLKPCAVVLKRLSKETIRQAIANSPLAKNYKCSPVKDDLKSKEPKSVVSTNSSERRSREADEKRLEDLLQKRKQLEMQMEMKRMERNIFEDLESDAGTSGAEVW